jgi:trigger factor
MGDVLDGTISVTIDGEKSSNPEPFAFVLGQGRLPKTVEEALVGLEVGQSKSVRAPLPEGLNDASKAGKEAEYTIQLITLSERIFPELDDAFAQSLNFDVKTVAELREKLNKQLHEAAERDQKKDVQAAALDVLCEKNEFLVPQPLIDDEIRELLVRYNILDPNKQDISRVPVDQYRPLLGDTATRRVKGAVIVDQIAKAEKVEVKEEDITSALQTIADENKVGIDEVRKFFMAEQRMIGLMTELRRTKVLESLVSSSKVEYFDPEKEPKPEAKKKEAKADEDQKTPEAEAPKKKKASKAAKAE